MKELSIEGKATRYDEALKEAVVAHKDEDRHLKATLERIFPELKESENEGEKIRKNLITLFKDEFGTNSNARFAGIKVKDIIAWLEKQGDTFTKKDIDDAYLKGICDAKHELEKQGEKHIDRELSNLLNRVICRFINDHNIPYSERDEVSKKIIPYVEQLEKQGEHTNFLDKIQVGDKVTRNEDGVLVNLSQLERVAKPAKNKCEHDMGISEATKKKLEDNLNKALEKETPESWNKFLEGEQKYAYKVEPRFKVGDEIRTKNEESLIITRIDRWGYWSEDLFICNFDDADKWELVEQKPTDKEMKELLRTEYEKGRADAISEMQKPWSEEDEETLKDIITSMTNLKDSATSDALRDIYNSKIDWLKSLRPRNMWKPSDEQMNGLNEAIEFLGCTKTRREQLQSLYEQLKKLRKE